MIKYCKCIPDGEYESIGDFVLESQGLLSDERTKKKPISAALVIKGLMDPNCMLQVKLSKEYSEKAAYYDRMAGTIKDLNERRILFDEWKAILLHEWQFKILQNIMTQNNCLLYTSPSPRDKRQSRMPSSA